LIPIHRQIGAAQQLLGVDRLMTAAGRHAHAHRHPDLLIAESPGIAEAIPQSLRQHQRITLLLEALHQHHELIPAETGQSVVAAQHLLQALAELQQQRIPGGVAMPVVDLLEAVEVSRRSGPDSDR